MNLPPSYRTSAMLLAPTLEEHLSMMRNLFSDSDVILDVGCTYESIGHTKVDEDTDLSSLNLSEFNSLLFQESIGYLTGDEFAFYLTACAPRKIVIKDFLLLAPMPNYMGYNFDFFHSIVIPVLLAQGYLMSLTSFTPYKERWKKIMGDKYKAFPQVVNVIGVFSK